MIEPYLLDIAIEVLKLLGGIMIPVITTIAILYKNKLERRFKKGEVQREIDRYANFAQKLRSFEMMPFEDRIQTIKDDILIFIQDNDIVMSEMEINLMIEKALTVPLKLFRLQEAQNERDI